MMRCASLMRVETFCVLSFPRASDKCVPHAGGVRPFVHKREGTRLGQLFALLLAREL